MTVRFSFSAFAVVLPSVALGGMISNFESKYGWEDLF